MKVNASYTGVGHTGTTNIRTDLPMNSASPDIILLCITILPANVIIFLSC